MATVANLKAKLVMDIGQFEEAAERAVGKARSSGKMIESALKKAGTSFTRTLGAAAVGTFGAAAVAEITSAVSASTEQLKNGGSAAEAVLTGVYNGILNIGKGIPIIGDLGTALVNVMNREYSMLAENNKMLNERANLLQKSIGVQDTPQQQVLKQIGVSDYTAMEESSRKLLELDIERKRVLNGLREEWFKFEELVKSTPSTLGEYGDSQQRFQDIRKQFAERYAALQLDFDLQQKQIEQAQERAKLEESIAEAKRQQAEEAAIIQREDQAAASFLDNLQSQYEALTLSERERLELQMQRLKLWPEEIEAATKLYDQIQRAKELQDEQRRLDDLKAKADEEAAQNRKIALEAMDAADRASSVETLDTAIGGVKVQGMMDASLSRLVPLQEAQKAYLKAIADNTKPAAGGAP